MKLLGNQAALQLVSEATRHQVTKKKQKNSGQRHLAQEEEEEEEERRLVVELVARVLTAQVPPIG